MSNTTATPTRTESVHTFNGFTVTISAMYAETGIYLEASAGKTTAAIGITEHSFQIIINNAMHRAYKGSGKVFFGGASEALANYKKPEIKAIILAADSLNK